MNRSAQKALQSTAVGQVASKRKGSVKSQKQPKEVIVADFSMQLKAFGFTTSWPYKSFHDLKVGKDEDRKLNNRFGHDFCVFSAGCCV